MRGPDGGISKRHPIPVGSGECKSYARRGKTETKHMIKKGKWDMWIPVMNERVPLHPENETAVWGSCHKGLICGNCLIQHNTTSSNTLLHPLKSFELLNSLWGADESNSSIEDIRIGVEGKIRGTIQKKVRQGLSVREVNRRDVSKRGQESRSLGVKPIATQ